VAEKKRRRTQAERSAATRRALLDAAIKCLFEHGYGATTTIMVSEEAGVSRGAMLHQFASKADLMTFVVEEVFREELSLYAELLPPDVDPRERLLAYPEVVWKVLSRPAGIAVLEILQGSRSDAALAEKLAPVEANIYAVKDRLYQQLHRAPSTALVNLIVGLVRGLSITRVIAPKGEDVEESIRLLQKLLKAGLEAGVFPGWGETGATEKEPATRRKERS
jgi:AcrR family transcriptional regulator